MDNRRSAVASGQQVSGIHTPKVVQMATAGGAQRPKAMQYKPESEIYFQFIRSNPRVYTNL
jgi:hypothetical protein